MEKKIFGPDLARTINRQSQMLAASRFNAIRTQLERQAIGLLRAGKSQAEAERVILGLVPPDAGSVDGSDLI